MFSKSIIFPPRTVIAFAFSLAAVAVFTSSAEAQNSDCDRLWIRRNTIFKNHGYCFKTSRAIAFFGNDGCRFNSLSAVRLSPSETRLVEQLQTQEAALNCSASGGGNYAPPAAVPPVYAPAPSLPPPPPADTNESCRKFPMLCR